MYSSHYNINLDMILLYRITQTAPGGDLPATMDLYHGEYINLVV